MPQAVWNYAFGGYGVLKKWLSYRERDVLGRAITKDGVRDFTHIVQRVATLVLMQPELDANYVACKASFYPWQEADKSAMVPTPPVEWSTIV